MTKKLHELIELANQGKKFIAKNMFAVPFSHNHFLNFKEYSVDQITCDWTYEEIKEPIKLEFEGFVEEWLNQEGPGNSDMVEIPKGLDNRPKHLGGKKFKIVMTEVPNE